MGAFCCVVAAGPLVTRSPASGRRDFSSLRHHDDDLHWRTNLSFSPARDSRDLFLHDSAGESHGSALPLGRSRRNGRGPVSDLVSGSMPVNFQQAPRRASSVNSSSTSRGSRIMTPQFRPSKEEQEDHAPTALCSSVDSSTSLSESSAYRESTRKQPFSPSWCSYPRVFCNPVSECENPELAHARVEVDSSIDPKPSITTSRRNYRLSPSLFQPPRSTNEGSTEPSTSSSREEMELNIERLHTTESRNQRYSSGSTTHQKCGVCGKLLSQKSPWSSYKIMRSRDMPTAGILPCCHIYHVECLDQVTPKAQTRDPPCPVCSKASGAMEEPLIVPETLQFALRSLRRSRIGLGSEPSSEPSHNNHINRARRRSQQQPRLGCCLNINFSSSSRNRI